METAKRAAGHAAADRVEDGMALGLGTGSTVAHFLDRLAERGLADVAGVPTSAATAARCRQLGLRLLDPADVATLDRCVDGADELTSSLVLTKGGGGALLREKTVAAMSREMMVIATVDKVVERLGDSFPLPVEVVPFARWPATRRLEALGFHVQLRGDGERTDNGNLVLDCRMPDGITDPEVMDVTLALIPGVAEHGLFAGMASSAILGHEDGTSSELAPPVA